MLTRKLISLLAAARLPVAIALIAVVVATACPAADRVVLESGEVLFGKLLRYNRHEVSLKLASGGVVSFSRQRVTAVRLDPLESTERLRYMPIELPEKEKLLEQDREDEWLFSSDDAAQPERNPRRPPTVPPFVPGDGGEEPEDVPQAAPAAQHYTYEPPAGFERVQGKLPRGTVESYRDPKSGATCTIAVESSPEGIEAVKRSTTHATASQFTSFRVVEDRELDSGGRKGLIVEVEGEIGDAAVHQLQFFAQHGEQAVVLTCRAPEKQWSRLEEAFLKSIQSLKEKETSPGGRGKGTTGSIKLPGGARD